MKRLYLLTPLFAIALSFAPMHDASANRGPFSAIYQMHLTSSDSAYLGVVESIDEKILDSARPKEYAKVYTLKVSRTWRAGSPKTIAIADVYMSETDREGGIARVMPIVGEEWLVVAYKDFHGALHQDFVKALKIDSAETRNGAINALRNNGKK